jgi:hypothetical protein
MSGNNSYYEALASAARAPVVRAPLVLEEPAMVWILASSYMDTKWTEGSPATNIIAVYGAPPSRGELRHALLDFVDNDHTIAMVMNGVPISTNGELIILTKHEVR